MSILKGEYLYVKNWSWLGWHVMSFYSLCMWSCKRKIIKEVKGLVKGSTVRCKNIGRDITASFKNLVGGEMSGYNDMLTEARQIAIGRMVDEAEAIGANAIIGMKLMSSAVAARAAEMVAYGTAVVVE